MGMVRLVQVIQWRRCWGSGRMGLDTTSTSGERCDECCWGLGRMGTGTTRITDWSFLWVFLDGGFMLHLPRVIMERHRRFTLSSPLSCNTGLFKTLQITAGAPLSTVFERRYPALIWGVAAEDRVVGDEEANVEDGREEMMKVTGGDENTHGGNAAISGAIWGRKTGWATPSASKTPRRTNHHHLLQHCGIVSNLEIWTNRRLWTISNLHHLVPKIPLSVLGELRLLVWCELTQLTGRVVFKGQVSLV